MHGIIKNFRGGRKTQRPNQIIIYVEGIDSRAKASSLIGKKAKWKTSSGKIIAGKVTRVHGDNGAVIARLTKGLPGIAIGTKIRIE
ncbi:MAG: 50S ribosomal protein L35ae [Candidatus Diapherotrites archaeon]